MCDHSSVTLLSIQELQRSDGYTRYTCNVCHQEVKINDREFNRRYKRHYNLCIDHSEYPDYPRITDSNGNKCCIWCGLPDNV